MHPSYSIFSIYFISATATPENKSSTPILFYNFSEQKQNWRGSKFLRMRYRFNPNSYPNLEHRVSNKVNKVALAEEAD